VPAPRTSPPTTDWGNLLPTAVSERIVESAVKQSVVLQLATTRPMPAGVEHIPVVSVAPSASWVGAGARKPIAEIIWSAETLQAEEIAAIVAIPDVYISDTTGSWSPEESAKKRAREGDRQSARPRRPVRRERSELVPDGGIAAIAGTAVTGGDALEAVDGALTKIESDGPTATGVASSPAIGSALRAAYREAAALPGEAAASQIYGIPVSVTSPWSSSAPDAFVGAWENLVIGVREDVNVAISKEGVLVDEEGDIAISAFQDDQTVVRIYARFGVAVATP
jgi:hypothetical protein